MNKKLSKIINESKKFGYEGNAEIICSLEKINIFDEKIGNFKEIDPNEILDVVDDAMIFMKQHFKSFGSMLDNCKVMYIPTYFCPPGVTNTMAVDLRRNLWINMNFVYNQCDMDKYKVFGILFHEMFHIVLDHTNRFVDYFRYSHEWYERSGEWEIIKVIANICMDNEINTTMVSDGVVSEKFWEIMDGQYNNDYFGLTWEEIFQQHSKEEYEKYKKLFGKKVDENEIKLIEAIEKATKVLNNENSTNEEIEKATKELQKTLNKILGRKSENSDIQDSLENLKNIIGKYGDIEEKMENVIDDLYNNLSKMSKKQYDELIKDIDEMADEMLKHDIDIAEKTGKNEKVARKEIEKMRETMKNSLKQMREDKKMSKDAKEDAIDNIKDSLEDIGLSDMDKIDAEKRRKERDENKESERKEKLKKKHPLRKLINVFKNLIYLKEYNRVCEESCEIMENIVNILDKLSEIKISEIEEDDVKKLKNPLSELKESLFTDLKTLLDNKIIIDNNENNLQEILDDCFGFVDWCIFTQLINKDLDDDVKATSINTTVEKLRIIGKILKTQKKWKSSAEFDEGYRETSEELYQIFNKDKKQFLKKLFDLGAISESDINSLDAQFKALYDELVKEGKIK